MDGVGEQAGWAGPSARDVHALGAAGVGDFGNT